MTRKKLHKKEFLQKLRITEEAARKGITESVVRQMRELDNQELKRQEEELKYKNIELLKSLKV